MKKLYYICFLFSAVLVALGQAGCGGDPLQGEGHDHAHDHAHEEPHYHEPPHGGAGVTLGAEDAHIEFLVDAESKTVTAWFFKPHMERYLRMELKSFEVLAKRESGEVKLVFNAVANPGTGEKVGDTSQFLAKADWLSESESFDAVLPEITVLGKIYQNVAFNYPKGN